MASTMHRLKEADLPLRARKPGRHNDGGNLLLVVKRNREGEISRCSWIFRYYDRNAEVINPETGAKRIGTQREKGLGSWPETSLKVARDEAAKLRAKMQAAKNIGSFFDPIADAAQRREAEKAQHAKRKTFGECYRTWCENIYSHEVKEKQAKRALAMLTTYTKAIENKPIADVNLHDIVDVLRDIWHTKDETADKLRQHIRAVLNWARLRGYRHGDNPAELELIVGSLGKQDPSKRGTFPWLPYERVNGFMAELRQQPESSVSRWALEFMVLTAGRISEGNQARWDEIDMDRKLITIPADRMKNETEYRLPLSSDAMKVLRKMEELRVNDDPFVFPGERGGSGITGEATRKLLHKLLPDAAPKNCGGDGVKKTSQHGFRKTFSKWANEQTDTLPLVIEFSLSHQDPDKVRETYRQSDLLEKRRILVEQWASYCRAKPVKGGSKVVQMRRKRA